MADRSPFAAMAYPNDDVSQLVGLPTWVQDPEFPPCPTCGELMPFLGQVDTSVVAWGEGTIYAFVDAGCRTAATVYQQT